MPTTPRADTPDVRRVVVLLFVVAAMGCGHTDEELVLPWCKYRRVTGPGGSGIWGGSTHTEV